MNVAIGQKIAFPRMMRVRQVFEETPPVDIAAAVAAGMDAVRGDLKPGLRVAVAVGSRGITNLSEIVGAVIGQLKDAGCEPYIVPAMGSHGGASPEGQTELLDEYGVTEAAMGAPIHASLEVEHLGHTPEGYDGFFAREALAADAIVPINRVKLHTDFGPPLGSGLLKMLVVGLGKQVGAETFHRAVSRHGYEPMLRSLSRLIREKAPVLFGVGIVENSRHQTARIAIVPAAEMEPREEELLAEAKRLMPLLPFDDVDILVIDRIGKNISGSGMDPNVTGRNGHGYNSHLRDRVGIHPDIRRIFVRNLTPQSHGNATGIGMADVTTQRLVDQIDHPVTDINVQTSNIFQASKVPMTFATDHDAMSLLLHSLVISDTTKAKVIRIANTLDLNEVEVSETYAAEVAARGNLESVKGAADWPINDDGNLDDLL
ncbi:MAG: DUF362 domain-containing protein [Verrucomicrobiota bacterium]|nr:DUF362 domain-containing protein [Verrucomicrobiota bacterium]